MGPAFTLRPARGDSDYEAFSRLFPLLETGDTLPSVERFRDEIAPQTTVAEREGSVLGLLYANQLAATGYVRILIVAPEAQRTGVGRALMNRARERFVAEGLPTWRLNVKPSNVAARALYESLGMRMAYASVSVRLPWAVLPALPEAPAGLLVREPSPDEFEGIEGALLFQRGQFSSAHALGTKVLRVARFADGSLAGGALFDPSFPGCFGFRARSPGVARALVESLRPRAPAEVPHVFLMVERDQPLADALVAAGAEPRLPVLHYEGSLA